MKCVFVLTAATKKSISVGHRAVQTRRATFNGSVFLRWDHHSFFFLIFSKLLKEPDDTRFVFIQFSSPFYVGQFNLTELIRGAEGKLLWALKMGFLLPFLKGQHLVLLRAYAVKSVLVSQPRHWLISVTSHRVYRGGGRPDGFRGIRRFLG